MKEQLGHLKNARPSESTAVFDERLYVTQRSVLQKGTMFSV